MGYRAVFKCKKCGCRFEGDVGNGFQFKLLRCARCGKEHRQKEEASVKLLKCRCGGKFEVNLLPRCPKCNGEEVEEIERKHLYD